MAFTRSADSAGTLRRLLLALLTVSLIGTAIELVLLGHYEDSWQLVPIFFIGFALAVIAAHVATGSAGSLRLLQVAMSMLIVAGVIGAVLHLRGSLEFQMEMDATQSRWQLFAKAIRAKSPPALAPGVLAELGLLGWLYAFRHPALGRRELP